MPMTITPENVVIGPARVYYRAVGVSTPWTSVGPTLDDVEVSIRTGMFTPDNIAGVLSPIMGLDVLRLAEADFSFTVAEVSGTSLAYAIPSSVLTAAVNADSGGGSSTTSAAVLAGATTIPFTAVTNFIVGDYFRIEAAANALVEYRQITAIATLDVSFRDPLLFPHANGTAVVETTGDKRPSVTQPITRRMPSTAYREWALTSESGVNWSEVRIPRGIATQEAIETTIGDEAIAGLRVTIGARALGSNLDAALYTIYPAI
jgi:hypothetical protein